MFSRISQIGKNLSDEFESVVNNKSNNSSSSRPSSRSASSSGQDAKRLDGRPDSASMQTAFTTLKNNAKLLNSQTPEPGQLEVVFNSEEGAGDGDDERPDSEAKTKEKLINEGKGESAGEANKSNDGASAAKEHLPPPTEASGDATPSPSSQKNNDVHISKEIASKLRKFRKYEEKYPGMHLQLFFVDELTV